MEKIKNEQTAFLSYLLDKLIHSYKKSAEDRDKMSRIGDFEDLFFDIELIDIAYAGIVNRIQRGRNIREFTDEINIKTVLANPHIRTFTENYFHQYTNYVNYILNLEVIRTIVILILKEQDELKL